MLKFVRHFLLITLSMFLPIVASGKGRYITAYPVSELQENVKNQIILITDSIRQFYNAEGMARKIFVVTNINFVATNINKESSRNSASVNKMRMVFLSRLALDSSIYRRTHLWSNTHTTKFGYIDINGVTVLCIGVPKEFEYFKIDKQKVPKKFELHYYEITPVDDGVFRFDYQVDGDKFIPIYERFPE